MKENTDRLQKENETNRSLIPASITYYYSNMVVIEQGMQKLSYLL